MRGPAALSFTDLPPEPPSEVSLSPLSRGGTPCPPHSRTQGDALPLRCRPGSCRKTARPVGSCTESEEPAHRSLDWPALHPRGEVDASCAHYPPASMTSPRRDEARAVCSSVLEALRPLAIVASLDRPCDVLADRARDVVLIRMNVGSDAQLLIVVGCHVDHELSPCVGHAGDP